MLHQLVPFLDNPTNTRPGAMVSSKDHRYWDSGNVTAHALSVKSREAATSSPLARRLVMVVVVLPRVRRVHLPRDARDARGRALDATLMSSLQHACPCCGYQTLAAPAPGSWLTCEVCGWTDEGGEEAIHLERLFWAQRAFLEKGRSSWDAEGHVRAPREEEARAADWQPMDGVIDGPSPKERECAALEAEIIAAFAGVSPEGRATLRDAYYADNFREMEIDWDDHDTDWRQIPEEVLQYFGFMANVFIWGNLKSFHYYLPAYMIYELHGGAAENVVFALDLRVNPDVPFLERDEVRILTHAQRAAVVRFLRYVVTFDWGSEFARRALERVWLPSLALS